MSTQLWDEMDRVDKIRRDRDAKKKGEVMNDSVTTEPYWNGKPCKVEKVRVIVGKALQPTWWCAKLEGQERDALKITSDGSSFYCEDEPGVRAKLANGGMWNSGSHKSLPVEREVK